MNEKAVFNRIFTGKYLIFFFYLFMLVCGFVAGTKIWPQGNAASLVSTEKLFGGTLSDIMTVLVLPPTALLVFSAIIALFAGGWLLLPVVIYSAGAIGGYLGCGIFSDKVITANIGVLLSFAASYFCCFAIITYACVYSHTLSHTLSCGGICRSAYKGHSKSTIISIVLIIITSFIFSLLIYCLFSFVKH